MNMPVKPERARRFSLRNLRRDDKAVAAVEFALILPLMLLLYIGSIQVTQGVLASRKMAILSRTLSDIVAQQPTAITSPCTATGLCDSAMTGIFDAAASVMSPFRTSLLSDGTTKSLEMTVSSVKFFEYDSTASIPSGQLANTYIPTTGQLASATAPTTTNKGYLAQVKWSKTSAGTNNVGTLRTCSYLTPADNTAAASATTLPKGLYASGAVVIADVKYKYEPQFGGSVVQFTSGGLNYIAMSNSTYMRPRNWTDYITYDTAKANTTNDYCKAP
jgi:Flp pilus assembly pilin Flp